MKIFIKFCAESSKNLPNYVNHWLEDSFLLKPKNNISFQIEREIHVILRVEYVAHFAAYMLKFHRSNND